MPPKPESSKVTIMTEKVTLSVLTKFIKGYNGDRELLPAFLTDCDNAMSLATPDQQSVLCKFIISQLEGKAKVACSLKTFTTWSEIKNYLRSTFGEKKHATHLLVDLQSCKQLSSEDVTKYSLRIESILTRIQSDIHYNCKDEKELTGRIAAMEDLALNTFMLGLNPSISTIVRCRNPADLNEAVQHAIEEEKLYNLSKSNSTKFQKQCSICNKLGHNSSECFKNKKYINRNSQVHRSFHVNSNPNSNTNPNFHTKHNSYSNFNSNPKTCNYCKNIGHTIAECRKRQYNMQRRENANAAQPEPNTSNDNRVRAVRMCDFNKSTCDDNLN